jgi:hypothetical protein
MLGWKNRQQMNIAGLPVEELWNSVEDNLTLK